MGRQVHFPAENLLHSMTFWDADNFSEYVAVGATKYDVAGVTRETNLMGAPLKIGGNAAAAAKVADAVALWRPASGKPFEFTAHAATSLTASAGNDNYFLGVTQETDADNVVPAGGGGPAASFNGFGFLALAGKSNLHVCYSSAVDTLKVIELDDISNDNLLGRAVSMASASPRIFEVSLRDTAQSPGGTLVFTVDGEVVAEIRSTNIVAISATGALRRSALVRVGAAISADAIQLHSWHASAHR